MSNEDMNESHWDQKMSEKGKKKTSNDAAAAATATTAGYDPTALLCKSELFNDYHDTV